MLTKMAEIRLTMLAAIIITLVLTQPTKCSGISLPAIDPESLPNTNFSCIGKVIGGYYADVYTGCQMFHVCTLDEKGEIHDYKFGCILGTVFDQETRVCERTDEVDCSASESFFHLNDELYGPGIIPPTAVHRVTEGATSGADFTTTTQTAFVFPETNFACHDKVTGGLYADVETGCVVFHICSVGPDSSITDNKFVCGEGTVFDQKSRTCQVASAVDCSLSESLYHLNDRLKGPESVVDLCLSQPLGTPLADLTSGCGNYMICESSANGQIVERNYSCKKDYLFSQLRKRCLLAKKVNCIKETLSGILGLDASKTGKSRSRVTRSLLLHRFRRAALSPLVNVVTKAGVEEDASVRRALYNLASLQRWALENARDTAFIEVYTLNTKDASYPKKAYDGGTYLNRYVYLQRKKRDVANVTLAEQAVEINETKTEQPSGEPVILASSADQEQDTENPMKIVINPTSTIPFIPTITIPPKTKKPTLSPSSLPETASTQTSLLPSTALSSSLTKVPVAGTLSTLRVNNTGARTTFVTLPPATVTVTDTVTVGITTTESPIVSTAVPTLPQALGEATTPLPAMSSVVTAVNLVKNINDSTAGSAIDGAVENSTPLTQALSTDREMVELITPSEVSSTTESSADSNPSVIPSPGEEVADEAAPPVDLSIESSVVSENSTSTPLVQSGPANNSSTSAATAQPIETAITKTIGENVTHTEVLTNITTTTAPSVTEEATQGSANVSSTTVASDLQTTNNASVTPVTKPTVGPFTRDNLPETNFTCKNKTLEQFYPDTEANCQVFHYCSPGFQDRQILDLKFLCTGATMFDVNTQKCENMSSVTCGQGPTTITPPVNETDTTDVLSVNATMGTQPSEGVVTEETTSSASPAVTTPVTEATTSQVVVTEETVSNTTTAVTNASTAVTQSSEVTTVPTSEDTTLFNATTVRSAVMNTTNEMEESANVTTGISESTLIKPTVHNWNSTSGSHIHQKANNTSVETVTVAEVSNVTMNVTQASESLTEIATESETVTEAAVQDPAITNTADPVSLSDEPVTMVSPLDVETVTERLAREEISTSTSNMSEIYTTTEFTVEDESLITTELGPFNQSSDVEVETVTLKESESKQDPIEAVQINESAASRLEPIETIEVKESPESITEPVDIKIEESSTSNPELIETIEEKESPTSTLSPITEIPEQTSTTSHLTPANVTAPSEMTSSPVSPLPLNTTTITASDVTTNTTENSNMTITETPL